MMLWVTLACVVAAAPGSAETEDPPTAAEVGQALYERHCAVCHGLDARGGGEFANLLTVPPPDLTAIATRRGGSFPAEEIGELIDGRLTPRAHGNPEMPVWGRRLGAASPGRDGEVEGEVYLVVEYLRSLQPAATASPQVPEEESRKVTQFGGEQFQRNCASCHGVAGAGDGPVGASLASPPPDLRTIARRNGGTFPTLRVARVIDGRDRIAAHGSRDMPIWGKRLRAPGGLGRDAVVRGEVMLYVDYLRSIQAP